MTASGSVNVTRPEREAPVPGSKDATTQPAATLSAAAPCAPEAPYPMALMTDDGYRWRAPAFCQIASISYRQCDYWVRTGRLHPAVDADGSGSQRLFDEAELRVAIDMGWLLNHGFAIQWAHDIARELQADRVVALSDRLYLVRVP